jgi:ElaB/YqjD/DUF883 family membrane-anchored ribosome-binding protein
MTETTAQKSATKSLEGAAEQAQSRDALRAKIEAAERRNAERTLADDAREATGAATTYVKENPLTVLGGAIALGLVIGLLTRPGRRVAHNAATSTVNAARGAASGTVASVGNVAKKRGSALGTLIADAMVAYGIKLIDDVVDGAEAGKDAIEDMGDSASARMRKASRQARFAAGNAADDAQTVAQRTRRRATRAVRSLKDRVAS